MCLLIFFIKFDIFAFEQSDLFYYLWPKGKLCFHKNFDPSPKAAVFQ